MDPDEVEAAEETLAALRQHAALTGAYYEALKTQKLPDDLVNALIMAWSETYWISDNEQEEQEIE